MDSHMCLQQIRHTCLNYCIDVAYGEKLATSRLLLLLTRTILAA